MSKPIEVSPRQALLVIAIAAILIYGYVWANNQLLEIGGPSQMRLDERGNLYINVSGQLFKINHEDQSVVQTDLRELGVQHMVGDFDFFSNGDVLLRRGDYDPDLIQGLQLYARIADASEPVPENPDEGLFRCNLSRHLCERFGNIDFHSAFHIVIDRDDDSVYISDTNRHSMRKYSQDGRQLANKDGFLFPNHSMIVNSETAGDKQLLVADTNHHTIKRIDVKTNSFGTVIERYPVNTPDFGFKNWVFSFAQVGENWWVNNMANTMSYGLVGMFDQNFRFIRLLNLPANADPNDIVVFNNLVYISDLANNRIYRFTVDGEPSTDPLPEVVADYLGHLDNSRIIISTIKYTSITLFALFLIAGFVFAARQEKAKS